MTNSSNNPTLGRLEDLRVSPSYVADESCRRVVDKTITDYRAGVTPAALSGFLYLCENFSVTTPAKVAAATCQRILTEEARR